MRLTDDAILNRSEMLDVLISDARFAHASVNELAEVIDRIYTSEGRESPDRIECAPDILYNAWRQGKLTDKLYVAWPTTEQAVIDVHMVCCICGHISGHGDNRIPTALREHLAPRVTTFQYIEDGEICTIQYGATPPVCGGCSYHFVKRGRRKDYWAPHSNLWNEALAEIAINKAAKQRMKNSAISWAKLRFDPRYSIAL